MRSWCRPNQSAYGKFPRRGHYPRAELRTLHIQHGHANKLDLLRTSRAGKIKVEPKVLGDVLRACPCEIALRDQIQPPVVGPHRVFREGSTVMRDIWYPAAEGPMAFPYMIAIGKFSRFVVTRFLENISVLVTKDISNSR